MYLLIETALNVVALGVGVDVDLGAVHEYHEPGAMQSISGTIVEHAASDQRRPLVLNSRNCTYHAPDATSEANSTRPSRESGVVFGSEIMKNVNNSSAPLSSRCSGIVGGSPRYSERPKRSAQ